MRLKPTLMMCVIAAMLASCATSKLPPLQNSQVLIPEADRIILKGEYGDDIYKETGQYLTDLGFIIESSDKDLGTIQTDMKNFTKGIWQYNVRVNVSIRNGEVHFYGNTSNPMSGESEIENRGGNNSQMKNSFLKLEEIAKGFPHTAITYSRN